MELTKQNTTTIKGLAILIMVWHHLFLNCYDYGHIIQLSGAAGKICVALFLFLSGYGLTITFRKRVHDHTQLISKDGVKCTLQFLLHRFKNFYLSYWPMMVGVILLGVACGYSLLQAYPNLNPWKRLLIDAAGYNGWQSYLNTWWFNKLIIQIWLLFPFLYLLLSNRWLAMIGGAGLVVVEQFQLIPFFCFIEGGVFTFFVGMVAARYTLRISRTPIYHILAVLALVGLMLCWHYVPQIAYTLLHAPIALLIVSLFAPPTSSQTKIGAAIRFLGGYSTEIYLCHTLFLIICPSVVYALHFPLLDFAILLIMSLSMSMVVRLISSKIGKTYDGIVIRIINRLNHA